MTRAADPRDRWLQTGLRRLVAPDLVVDGVLGERSHRALAEFQRRVHEFAPASPALVVDGLAGPATIAALAAATGTRPPDEAAPAPAAGADTYVERRVGVRVYGTLPADSPLLVAIPAASPGPKRLHTLAAAALARMSTAAEQALGFPLKIASGWRPHRWTSRAQYEAELVRRYGTIAEGKRWLAFDSPHETGLAIDIGVGGLRPSRASADQQRHQPLHQWLVAHAHAFGWHPYKVEPWHWEHPLSLAAYRSGVLAADDPGPPPSAHAFGLDDDDEAVLEDTDLEEAPADPA